MQATQAPGPEHGQDQQSRASARTAMLLVFLLFACFPFYWAVHSAIGRMTLKYPQTPWESEILADAWRANHGMKVYTMPADDHATIFYGPLVTYLTAAIFRVSGFNITAARWIAMVSAILVTVGIAAMIATGAKGRRGWLIFFISICVLFMEFYRSRANFAESRPDTASALFSAIAVWMFYLAFTRNFWWMAVGVAAMVTGFFFKQTASATAFVPVIALLFVRPPGLLKRLMLAVIPMAAMGVTFVMLRLTAPVMYHYLVVIPTQFPIYMQELPIRPAQLISMNTLFFAALVAWAINPKASGISRQASLWMLATVVALAVSGSVSTAKWGGKENNYLPVYLAMATFSLSMLPRLLDLLAMFSANRQMQLLLAAALGVLVISDATSVPNYEHFASASGENNGDAGYERIIHRVAHLHGSVICPDDPTIPLQAKGRLNRCVVCEMDSVAYKAMPQFVFDEWKRADYVIRAPSSWPSLVLPEELSSMGFVKVSDPVFAKTKYELWHRKSKATSHSAK